MTTEAQVDRIRRVGDRLVQTAGLGDRTWDYAVFTEASPNAFVLPSGQIGVTTSLLALVRDDDGGAGFKPSEAVALWRLMAAQRQT